jgi:hypothetical protein
MTSKRLVINTLKRVIGDFCQKFGNLTPFYDDKAFDRCAEEWQEEIFRWTKEYQEQFATAYGGRAEDETLSHIKHAGALLYAFTQRGHEPVQAIRVGGILPEKTRDLVTAFPNETLMFMAVYWLFCEQQYQRGIDLKFDPEVPPMNPRYLRAIVHYLRRRRRTENPESCDSGDLYLIFKTMDLYGGDNNYSA